MPLGSSLLPGNDAVIAFASGIADKMPFSLFFRACVWCYALLGGIKVLLRTGCREAKYPLVPVSVGRCSLFPASALSARLDVSSGRVSPLNQAGKSISL